MATATPGTRNAEKLFTRAFILLALGELAYLTADGIAIYLVPVYATGPVGTNHAGAGLAFGAFALSALLLRPIAGRLCDTRGRRPLLVWGAALAAVALLLTAQVDDLVAVVVLRLLAGVAEAAVFVAIFAAVADLAPPSRLGEAISYNSLALYLGLALGPPLGEYLVESHGFAAGWYAAATLAVVAAIVLAALRETRDSSVPVPAKAPLVHRRSLPVALGFLTSVIAMGGFLAYAALHADAVGLQNASLPLFVYGGVVVIGRVAFARVPDRLPPLGLGAAALVIMAAGLGTVALWPTPAGLLVGTAILALGVTFSTPAFFSAIFQIASASERGAASATVSACLDLGLGGGPILLGIVAQSSGIAWALAVAAGVSVIGAMWTISQRRVHAATT